MISNSLITSLSSGIIVITVLSSAAKAEQGVPKAPQAPLADVTHTQATAKSTPVAKSAHKETAKEAANEAAPIEVSTKALALGKVDAEVENDLTIVTAKLNGLPSWKNLEVEDHGTFIQVKLPQTNIPSSGEFFDGNGPFLKKIATFQIGESDGALRLFLNQDAAKAKLATTAELLGERVVITIDHKKLEQLIQPNKDKAVVAVEGAPLAAAAGTVKAGESDAPSDVISAAKTETKKALAEKTAEQKIGDGPEGLNLKDKLMTAAGFCAAMLLLLLGSTIWRNKRIKTRKTAKQFENVEPAPMRILNNLSVSNRQRLSLVQVGNQQILIGISPENISFLTNVETRPKASQPSAQSSFGTHLLNANPDAEVRLKQADAASSRPVRRPAEATTAQRPQVKAKPVGTTTSSRVNVAVGDDGVSDLRARGVKNDRGTADQPFDDITKLIRDRLKNLPPAP